MRNVVCSKGELILVDEEDLPKLLEYNWYLAKAKTGLYYARMTCRKKIYLHRLVMNAIKGQVVDHIDGDTLNCQKSNLRFVTSRQNAANKKVSTRNKLGIKGVSFDKSWNKYVAQIMHQGINHRQWFDSIEAASLYYNYWSEKLHGEYRRNHGI